MNKKNLIRKKRILITILIILLLLLFSLIFFISFNKLKNNNNTKENNTNKLMNKEQVYSAYIDWNNTENIEIINQNKYNISKKIKKGHEYPKYKFNNMEIYTKNNRCYLEFEITNINYSKENINHNIFIKFVDKENNIIHFMEYSLPNLKIDKKKKETIELTIDVSNAYDYSVEGF